MIQHQRRLASTACALSTLMAARPGQATSGSAAPSGRILGSSLRPALFAQQPPPGQVPFEATLGGEASLVGLRFPVLDVQGSGTGRATLGGAAPAVFNLTPEMRASINLLAPD